jgi:hypothetical protein
MSVCRADRRSLFSAVATVMGVSVAAGCGARFEPEANPASPIAAEVRQEPAGLSHGAPPSFYTVAEYDEARDPNVDLTATLNRAKWENKHVILQVGGDWCSWCKRITDYMSDKGPIRELVSANFVVMKVTYPGNHAESFLSNYPKCDAYPHLFVLDSDGKLLHSQGTGELEQGNGYNDEVFAAFLAAWSPARKP